MSKNKNESIETLLTKGIENIYPNREFLEKKLKSNEKLTIYLGIDPTGPTLHVGHAIPLRKLREFQNLGHKVILLIGNFTALCGDPDKSHTRKILTTEEIDQNLKNYKSQIGKILQLDGDNPVEFKFNNDWLGKLNFRELIDIASHFTVQQMIERDLFKRRLEKGNPIKLHEFFYPLMQAYDSVAMDVDGEIGGNDQTFNMLAGRDLMKSMSGKEKFVLTLKLLADPTGKKMGKTEGNMITMEDEPNDMFGKVMSWPDTTIAIGFELLTNTPLDEIKNIEKQIADNATNPRDIKARLAREIVASYYSTEEADSAEAYFNQIFRDKNNPDEMPEIKIEDREYDPIEIIALTGFLSSNSDARRLITQNAVKLNDKIISDPKTPLNPEPGSILRVGKRNFAKLIK